MEDSEQMLVFLRILFVLLIWAAFFRQSATPVVDLLQSFVACESHPKAQSIQVFDRGSG
jgi:hypothetical protein